MTRKRFIKLLMAEGWSRNTANAIAACVSIANRHGARVSHKNLVDEL